MANIRKFSDMRAIGHLLKHYNRSVEAGHYSNTDIDENKISQDYNLAPERGKETDYIKQKIDTIMDGKTLRKDAVRMCCCVVNAPKNLPPEKEEIFFVAVYDFLVARYGGKSDMGEDVVVSAWVHKDETEESGHIHFAWIPCLKKDGSIKLCAKEAVGRSDMRTLHSDLGQYLENLGICKARDIKNGKTQRDSSGRALSVRELKSRSRERERNRERSREINREMRW